MADIQKSMSDALDALCEVAFALPQESKTRQQCVNAERGLRDALSDLNLVLEDSTRRQAEIGRLTVDLAEADRRAGAAERRMADLEDTIFKANRSMDRMKEEAGYDTNVSFDIVWAETLAKAKR